MGVSIEQSWEFMGILGKQVRWGNVQRDLQPLIQSDMLRIARDFEQFIENGGRVIVVNQKISINRIRPFDPTEFRGLGENWAVEEEDKRSLALIELIPAQICLKRMIRNGETWVRGEDKLLRLKQAGYIRLDAQVFQALWENHHLIPEAWKEKRNGTTHIFFDGTVLRRPDGRRCVLCLFWQGGEWNWRISWLENGWDRNRPSAVLVPSERAAD